MEVKPQQFNFKERKDRFCPSVYQQQEVYPPQKKKVLLPGSSLVVDTLE